MAVEISAITQSICQMFTGISFLTKFLNATTMVIKEFKISVEIDEILFNENIDDFTKTVYEILDKHFDVEK